MVNATLNGQEKYEYVKGMFGRIAETYDLINFLMTGGQDSAWRRFVIERANLQAHNTVLDIASGTGDIAFEAVRQVPSVQAVAADFALPMMHVGQHRELGDKVAWSGADAMNLPFDANTFDAVTAGYLLRNVPNIPQTLQEVYRVLRPGGRFVVLDSSPPPPSLIRPFIKIHLHYVIPTLGGIISGQPDAYQYLPQSTQLFKTPQELVSLIEGVGFHKVDFQTFMFGTIAIHWAEKPL